MDKRTSLFSHGLHDEGESLVTLTFGLNGAAYSRDWHCHLVIESA